MKIFLLFLVLILSSCSDKVMSIYLKYDIMHVNIDELEISYETDLPQEEPIKFGNFTSLSQYVGTITAKDSDILSENLVAEVESLVNNGQVSITIYPAIDTNGITTRLINEVFLTFHGSNTTKPNVINSVGWFCDIYEKRDTFVTNNTLKSYSYYEVWGCD